MTNKSIEKIKDLLLTQFPEVTVNLFLEEIKNKEVNLNKITEKTGSIKETFKIFNLLLKNNLVKSRYEVYCPDCEKKVGKVYEVLNQIPDTFECSDCKKTFNGIEHSYLIYEII